MIFREGMEFESQCVPAPSSMNSIWELSLLDVLTIRWEVQAN